jgi:hypothetical protein
MSKREEAKMIKSTKEQHNYKKNQYMSQVEGENRMKKEQTKRQE